ncbi:MAG: hypothetical protein HY684_05440 [Chloroflexi bacterium]|nr:hypothetical protein [Chloroflexota bacterium]
MSQANGAAEVYRSLGLSPDDLNALLTFDAYKAQVGASPEARLTYAGMTRHLWAVGSVSPARATPEQVQACVQRLQEGAPDTQKGGVTLLALHLRALCYALGNEAAATALGSMTAPSQDALAALPGWLSAEVRERLFWTPAQLEGKGPAVFQGAGLKETSCFHVALVDEARLVWVLAGTAGARVSWALVTQSLMGPRVRMRGAIEANEERRLQRQDTTGLGTYTLRVEPEPGVATWWVAVEEHRPPASG